MTAILLCATPLAGHVGPLTTLGADLRRHGYEVHLLTGSRFATSVDAAGIHHHSLSGAADFDERDPSTFVPHADRYTGLALSRYQVEQTFVRPIPDQAAAVERLVGDHHIDAVLTDGTFAGALPLLSMPAHRRPPVLGVGVMPLAQTSADVAPFNSGMRHRTGRSARLRNRLAHAAVRHLLFRRTQQLAARLVADAGGSLDTFVLDYSTLCDRFLQMGPSEFEYARSDLASNTVFAGPVPPRPGPPTPSPSWWDDMIAGPRPLIHVTQGTLDNHDLSQLIEPTLHALADADVQVVVSTGGAPVDTIAQSLPNNARAASYLDYDALLPRTAVMITNGGFGGVLTALRHGVPVVVAPGAEDKPEVAARVHHVGVGIDLRTRRPTPSAIRTAVDTALTSPDIRRAATGLQHAIATYTPLETVRTELAATLTDHAARTDWSPT
ncbi:nucleotide disphospho-sugar-binding domain-containing protein [Rhodococcoides kroppenstedtii]|uniref:nucleotide disphospho-sugar-binding domain-containing protein n=1 Tax=Rhodococcoides kroppenstedtii TaxID=293050 RepID=UPI0028E9ABC8|nr:nucleotide disphospho-sugar-binding domain-containing protein [Rhodococcus kroppenstedtii]